MLVSEPLVTGFSTDFMTDPALPVWGVLLLIFALLATPMGPAEPTALVAGAMAATGGLSLWLAIPVVAVGMFVGDLITFLAAAALTHRLLKSDRSGRRLRRWQTALNAQHVWRDLAIAGLRFMPGARTPAALAARGSGVSTTRFCILAAIGAIAWAVVWVGAASVVEALPLQQLLPLLTIVAIAALVGWLYRSALTPQTEELETVETTTVTASHSNKTLVSDLLE